MNIFLALAHIGGYSSTKLVYAVCVDSRRSGNDNIGYEIITTVVSR